jgi:3-hydroxyisobutyrate dehydrogenase
MTTPTIGFVGLGRMGTPMSANIAAAGFTVVGFDAAGTAERCPPGVEGAVDLDDVFARCDTVLLSLPDGDASHAVAGALAASRNRRVSTVIDLSTVGPVVAAAVAAQLESIGVTYVDGPVSGGVSGAEARTISLMFAGPREVFDNHRALLDAFAGSVFDVGRHAGQGQAMKLLNNFLSATALAATSEAIAFGEAHGLAMPVMVDVLNVSSGRNTATSDKFPNRVITGTYDAGFRTALMAKDMRLYMDVVRRGEHAHDVGQVVCDVWQRADAALPGSDFSQIWQFVSGHH